MANPSIEKRGLQGVWRIQHTKPAPFQAFIPRDLPPQPEIYFDPPLQDALEQANRALGRLDGVTLLLPDTSLFLYFYVRKEAVLSSQIEGTQSSLSDLLLYERSEVPGVPIEDVQEVSNYVAALTHGLDMIRADLPLSSRLIRELHRVLLAEGRGSNQMPGEFRRSQNWIGGSRPGNALYVPPPAAEIADRMSNLERFIHDEYVRTPTLVKAALIHYQFETIHPFLDGNGRVGRLLIPLLLAYEGALRDPMLYISLYFKTNRAHYYDLLQRVRLEGVWEEWLMFFLEGVRDTADQAAETAQLILRIFSEDQEIIGQIGRGAGTYLRILHYLHKNPVFTTKPLSEHLGQTHQATNRAVARLAELGIVRGVTTRARLRIFVYDRYLQALSVGTEPLKV